MHRPCRPAPCRARQPVNPSYLTHTLVETLIGVLSCLLSPRHITKDILVTCQYDPWGYVCMLDGTRAQAAGLYTTSTRHEGAYALPTCSCLVALEVL